jgi:hypothetical protein
MPFASQVVLSARSLTVYLFRDGAYPKSGYSIAKASCFNEFQKRELQAVLKAAKKL